MNNYPTKQQLDRIENWDWSDLSGLMEFIKPLWVYADSGYWDQNGDEYHISTAGMSGNEIIIAAMERNHIWWMKYWELSTRGGHFVFKAQARLPTSGSPRQRGGGR